MAKIVYKGEKPYSWDSDEWVAKYLNEENKKEYVIVESGDTLHTIAIDHNVLYRDLALLNNLKRPYILHVGQKLKLPKGKLYRIKDGETYSSIAQKFNTTTQVLIEINRVEHPYIAKKGQIIRISGERFNSKDRPEILAAVPQGKPEKISSKPRNKKITKTSRKINIISPPKGRFRWPLNGKVISTFGPKQGGVKNDGINIFSKEGTPIKAAMKGSVVYAGNELSGYGNLVILKHKNGWLTAYAHQKDVIVRKGDKVKGGEVIGHVGRTGNVTSDQLHFAMRKGKDPINPLKYLPKRIHRK